MQLTIDELLRLVYDEIEEAAPASMKRNATHKKLARLLRHLGEWRDICVQIPCPKNPNYPQERGWITEDCNCK